VLDWIPTLSSLLVSRSSKSFHPAILAVPDSGTTITVLPPESLSPNPKSLRNPSRRPIFAVTSPLRAVTAGLLDCTSMKTVPPPDAPSARMVGWPPPVQSPMVMDSGALCKYAPPGSLTRRTVFEVSSSLLPKRFHEPMVPERKSRSPLSRSIQLVEPRFVTRSPMKPVWMFAPLITVDPRAASGGEYPVSRTPRSTFTRRTCAPLPSLSYGCS